MAADPVDPAELDGQARNAPLTRPRPGHADLAGMQKYGFDDARPVLERASARETAARVALGRGGEAFLEQAARASRSSPTSSARAVAASAGLLPRPGRRWRASTPTRCAASTRPPARRWSPRSTRPSRDGDTLGGVVEVLVYGLPPGLGSHVHWDRRLDSRLAGALMGIQAIKGVEVGDGFELARTARLAGPRRDRADRRRGAPPHRPGRRHRGRHDHRRGAAGPGGDEADLDVAPGAAHRRRRHRRAGDRDQPALRRVRGAGRRRRRRGDGRAGAGRRGAGEVRRRLGARRPAATPRAT